MGGSRPLRRRAGAARRSRRRSRPAARPRRRAARQRPGAGSGPTTTAGALAVAPASVLERPDRRRHRLAARADAGSPVLAAGAQRRARLDRPSRARAAGADGGFAICWRTRRSGQLTLRVVSAVPRSAAATAAAELGDRHAAGRRCRSTQPVVATWYGPGLLRPPHGLRRDADPLHRRRRRPHAAVRHPGHAELRRPDADVFPVIDRGPYGGARDARPDPRGRAGARHHRDRRRRDARARAARRSRRPTGTRRAARSTGATGATGPSGRTAGGATAPTS